MIRKTNCTKTAGPRKKNHESQKFFKSKICVLFDSLESLLMFLSALQIKFCNLFGRKNVINFFTKSTFFLLRKGDRHTLFSLNMLSSFKKINFLV